MALMLIGAACLAGALVIAQLTGLNQKLQLELDGERVVGTAEWTDEGVVFLRYEHPTGTVYRRRYDGGFGWQRPEAPKANVTLVYDPQRPNDFQPVGLWYFPGAAATIVFVMGLSLVLRGRKAMLGRREEKTSHAKGAKNAKKKGEDK